MLKILTFRILLIKLGTFLINKVILDKQSAITETEDPLRPVESTQFVLTVCVEHSDQQGHKLLSECYTLGQQGNLKGY